MAPSYIVGSLVLSKRLLEDCKGSSSFRQTMLKLKGVSFTSSAMRHVRQGQLFLARFLYHRICSTFAPVVLVSHAHLNLFCGFVLSSRSSSWPSEQFSSFTWRFDPPVPAFLFNEPLGSDEPELVSLGLSIEFPPE